MKKVIYTESWNKTGFYYNTNSGTFVQCDNADLNDKAFWATNADLINAKEAAKREGISGKPSIVDIDTEVLA